MLPEGNRWTIVDIYIYIYTLLVSINTITHTLFSGLRIRTNSIIFNVTLEGLYRHYRVVNWAGVRLGCWNTELPGHRLWAWLAALDRGRLVTRGVRFMAHARVCGTVSFTTYISFHLFNTFKYIIIYRKRDVHTTHYLLIVSIMSV